MNENILTALDFAQGPVFRAAFALMILGLARTAALALSDTIAAYITTKDKPTFHRKLRMHVLWLFFPSVVLRKARPGGSNGLHAYHLTLCALSLITRLGAIVIPTFMVAHVKLWERAFGISWPALSGTVADTCAFITIVAGLLWFLGRFYSPMLRRVEPIWSFFKPLILVLPFLTGYLAMHPHSSPLDYHFVMLLHVLFACLAFVMVPFGRLMSCMHTRLTDLVPEAAWTPKTETPAESNPDTTAHRPGVTS